MRPGKREPVASRDNRAEWRLVVLLLAEVAIFHLLAPSFLTGKNAAEIARLSVETGLLALAETCVIVTGGIDLSVGSMMGLSAVALGWLWRDAHVPLGLAVLLTLCLGALGGLLNAVLITRLRALPLIVTLGTYSLFRGLAEGLTEGVQNYTGFPASFL
jgi:rhamnose transport system substrate-binding protein